MSNFKPTTLKLLEGNPGCRPLNKNEPKPNPIIPECPIWLEPDAKKEWKRITPELERLGLLTLVDMSALAGYCQAYSRWKEAEEYITEHGMSFETANGCLMAVPEVSAAQKYLKLCQSFMIQFGLTPAARGRMIVANKEKEDPLEELLRNS